MYKNQIKTKCHDTDGKEDYLYENFLYISFEYKSKICDIILQEQSDSLQRG